MADLDQARNAKERIKERLAGKDGVRGIGIAAAGENGYLLKVNLAHPEALPDDDRPDELDGVEVRYEVVGDVRALDVDEPEASEPPFPP